MLASHVRHAHPVVESDSPKIPDLTEYQIQAMLDELEE